MKASATRHLKYVLGFGLGLALVALFLWNTNLAEFWQAIRTAHVGYVAAGVALSLVSYALRSIRWHYEVKPIKTARFSTLFEGIVVGFAVSGMLPGRLGEVVRPYILSVREKVKWSSAMATVVIDRILDGAAVLLLLAVYLVVGLRPPYVTEALQEHVGTMKVAGLTSFGILVVGLTTLWLLRWRTETTLRLFRRFLWPLPTRWADRLVELLEHFSHGLSVLSDAKSMALAFFWSVVVWVEIGYSHYLVIRAFDIELPFIAMFFLLAAMVIGVAVPTPGGMGGLQWTCAWGLALTTIPRAPDAVIDAAAMAVWGNSFIPVMLLGLVYLWKEGLSLGRLEKIAETEGESDSAVDATEDPEDGTDPKPGGDGQDSD